MPTYKPRPGIACIEICGLKLLAPTRTASEYCSYIHPLSVPEIIIWHEMNRGRDLARIHELCGVFIQKPADEISAFVAETMQRLCKEGFLIELPEEEDPIEEP